ncbi:per os infectivity factor 3-like protein [Glossina pallidipes salivary gland hypertrophy virus]|uniref:Per os infectivity factor 3-like protein n=2 Tax=Glossina hytrovirus (isolate Glossina pallidipes/Ethiopia/Seibersdorf/-) TaxID=379529 RepID=B0YLN0_GHVS|nr:per os infectivity factor 3-like protein [Glossina pallidipes salivary gland hypertrophy virus]ABQ08849.1 per os infectivity factor 3-like protein [Glossina pallidipes salivary gland hypertrophy virus]AMB48687.1 per os infectivity factor 3-like protein [Glossina pallidipes salivary gland hypertrophy virus]
MNLNYLIFLYMIFLICIFIINVLIIIFNSNDYPDIERDIKEKLNLVDAEEANTKVDCLQTTRYCEKIEDCNTFCDKYSDNLLYTCDEISRKCVLDDGSSNWEDDDGGTNLTCNKNHGFIKCYAVNELTSFWICLNTLPHIFTDDDKLKPFVCANGKIEEINDDGGDFNLMSKCKCFDGFIKVNYMQRPDIPVCLPVNLVNIFPSFIINNKR